MSEDLIPYTEPQHFHLAVEDYTTIEELAGLNYAPSDIALYLNVNKTYFVQEFYNVNSLVRYHYDRGKLLAKAAIDLQLATNAKNGNITAIQIYDKHANDNNLEIHKQRILYGA